MAGRTSPGVAQPFVLNRLSAKAGDINNQTREGYIEIFNMADIPSAALYGATVNARVTKYFSKHCVKAGAETRWKRIVRVDRWGEKDIGPLAPDRPR